MKIMVEIDIDLSLVDEEEAESYKQSGSLEPRIRDAISDALSSDCIPLEICTIKMQKYFGI